MNAIKALIERMGQAPQEFAVEGSWEYSRWKRITRIMYEESKEGPRAFTQDEIDTYLDGIHKIVRTQLEEHICIEILNPLRPDRNEQLELFPAQTAYPPGSPSKLLVRADMKDQALKLLEAELERDSQRNMMGSLARKQP